MKNIVYKLTFNKRKEENIMPFLYIGSKTKCSVKDGIIFDNRGKTYYGSSTWQDYSTIVANDNITVEVMFESESYKEVLDKENELHLQYDVVSSPEYFNKGLATRNSFHLADYGTFRNVETNKVVRLSINDPRVISGEYVGATKGYSCSPETNAKKSRSGEENGFYGKSHTEESKEKMRESKLGTTLSEEHRLKIGEAHKGVPKSDEHKRKIGRKGLITLVNKDTKESIRIPKEQVNNYDKSIWLNPFALKVLNGETENHTCTHCGKVCDVLNYNRWHNDNCKKKRNGLN